MQEAAVKIASRAHQQIMLRSQFCQGLLLLQGIGLVPRLETIKTLSNERGQAFTQVLQILLPIKGMCQKHPSARPVNTSDDFACVA